MYGGLQAVFELSLEAARAEAYYDDVIENFEPGNGYDDEPEPIHYALTYHEVLDTYAAAVLWRDLCTWLSTGPEVSVLLHPLHHAHLLHWGLRRLMSSSECCRLGSRFCNTSTTQSTQSISGQTT